MTPKFALSHVRLLVEHYAACHAFYEKTLGMTARFAGGEGIYQEFDAGGVVLALFRKDLMSEVLGTLSRPAQAAAQDAVALVFSVADVDAAAEVLRSRGVELEAEPQDRPAWMLRVAHFRDPDGNLIEINAPLGR